MLITAQVKAATAPAEWPPNWQLPTSTYMSFLRCDNCGNLLKADFSPQPLRKADGTIVRFPPTAAVWHCDAPPGHAPIPCTRASFLSSRLDVLVGRALREALRLYGHRVGFGPPEPILDVRQTGETARQQSGEKERKDPPFALPEALNLEVEPPDLDANHSSKKWSTIARQVRFIRKLSGQEDALLAMPKRWTTLQDAGLADKAMPERASLPVRPEPSILPQPVPPDACLWETLSQRAAVLWPGTNWRNPSQGDSDWGRPILEEDKRALLRDLGIWISIQVLRRTCHHVRVSRNLCQLGGRLALSLHSSALGFVGGNAYLLLEGNSELLAFRRWQHKKPEMARANSGI